MPPDPLAFARYARVKQVFTCLLSAPLLKTSSYATVYVHVVTLLDTVEPLYSPEMRTSPLIRTLPMVPAIQNSIQNYP